MATVLEIGDEEIEIPIPNFRMLKQVWPHIVAMQSEGTAIEKAEAVLGIVSIFLSKVRPDLTLEVLEDKLEVRQMNKLISALPSVLMDAGIVKPGDAKPGEA